MKYLSLFLIAFFCAAPNLYAQSWKTYPYHQTGSVLNFPRDEGYHPGEVVEWWYTNAHITGDSTGTDYSYMLTYFYYPTFGFDGFRILELSNETTGQFAQETQPCHYPTLSQDHLEIGANVGISGSTHEQWTTLKDSLNNLVPFQYHINATGSSGALNVTYNCIRRPLMVGGTGFLYEGITGYTYYYSETELQVTGTITLNGVTEPVHGIAWVDRQWGQFDPSNGEKYTWMSLQLSNGYGYNLWNIFNTANQIPDTSTYRFCSIYMNDSTDTTLSDFTLQRLQYVYSSDHAKCYDQKWRLTDGNTDLTLTATHSNNEVTLPFRFFEGSMDIAGTVNGSSVTGVGYVELLHSFSNPQIAITSPTGHRYWDASTPVTWHLSNPDDGDPLFYDVEVSTDNRATYTKIAHALTDTSFSWAPSLPNGTEGWFRVTAYSIDSTLAGTAVSDSSFILGTTGIRAMQVDNAKCYPNPFTALTTITYQLKAQGNLAVDILDERGAVVQQLFSGNALPGSYSLVWDGNGKAGTPVADGVYFYRIQQNGKSTYGKVVKGE
ncbi:MAG TPA: lipocalin-like domain-containing protein [Chitinophagales bacterium]|nr:lipocalin-like domain-containing protein [Chitinophagales bacterium]